MRVLIGLLVWIITLLLLIFPLTILFLIKLFVVLIVSVYGCIKRCTCSADEKDYQLYSLSAGDCIVSTDSSWKKPVVNVGFILKVDGNVDVKKFRKHFANCFNIANVDSDRDDNADQSESEIKREEIYDKFLSFLVTRGGYVFRACAKTLNLPEHIVERKLENGLQEGTEAGTEEPISLEDFIAQWMLQGYRENTPCWEIVVLPVAPDNEVNDSYSNTMTAIAFKMHHGICDGYSLLHIIDKLTGAKSPYLVKDFQDGFGVQLKQMLEAPLCLGRMGGLPPEKNPFRVNLPSMKDCKYEWMYSFTSFSLEDMKTLRRKNGNVHMTSVIWTVLTGALRRFLEEEGKIDEIPEFIKVGNTLPWPRHPAMSTGTMSKDKICNHWVAGILQVPLREPDPLVRLHQIEQEYVSYHTVGLDKFGKRVLFPVLWTLPGSLVAMSTSNDLGVSGGLTSLIGADSYSLMEFPVKHIHPILCIHDNSPYLPLSCFTFSHSGRMEMTLGANPLSILKNKQNLDRICHKLCDDEFQNFLTVTNNTILQS